MGTIAVPLLRKPWIFGYERTICREAGTYDGCAEVNVQPDIPLGKVDFDTGDLVDFYNADDACDDHKATESKDRSAQQLLLKRKL